MAETCVTYFMNDPLLPSNHILMKRKKGRFGVEDCMGVRRGSSGLGAGLFEDFLNGRGQTMSL